MSQTQQDCLTQVAFVHADRTLITTLRNRRSGGVNEAFGRPESGGFEASQRNPEDNAGTCIVVSIRLGEDCYATRNCLERLGGFVAQALRLLGETIRAQPSNRWIGLGVFGVVAAALIFRNQWIFHVTVLEHTDYAANSILVDKAMAGEWLVGHYSRFGFYHPGPFFLYLQGVGEFVFFHIFHATPSAFNAQFLAVVIFSSALIGVCTAVVGARLRTPLVALWVPAVLLTLTVLAPESLVSTWPPNMVVVPFALFLLSSASTLTGKPEHLPIALFAMCVLIHGHASFLVMCGAFALILGTYLTVLVRRRAVVLSRRTVIASVLVVTLFAAPIALNTLLNWPGEIPSYISNPHPPKAQARGFADVVRYLGDFWLATNLNRALVATLVVVMAIAAAAVAKNTLRRFLFGILAVSGIATVLTFGYAYKGIDKLKYDYLTAYYHAVPCLVVLVLILGIASLLDSRKWAAVTVAAAGGGLSVALLLTQQTMVSSYLGLPAIARVQEAVAARVSTSDEIVLQFDRDAWAAALGVVEEFRRDGRRICVDGPETFRVQFTKSEYCTPEEIKDGVPVKLVVRQPSEAPPDGIPLGEGIYLVFPDAQASS